MKTGRELNNTLSCLMTTIKKTATTTDNHCLLVLLVAWPPSSFVCMVHAAKAALMLQINMKSEESIGLHATTSTTHTSLVVFSHSLWRHGVNVCLHIAHFFHSLLFFCCWYSCRCVYMLGTCTWIRDEEATSIICRLCLPTKQLITGGAFILSPTQVISSELYPTPFLLVFLPFGLYLSAFIRLGGRKTRDNLKRIVVHRYVLVLLRSPRRYIIPAFNSTRFYNLIRSSFSLLDFLTFTSPCSPVHRPTFSHRPHLYFTSLFNSSPFRFPCFFLYSISFRSLNSKHDFSIDNICTLHPLLPQNLHLIDALEHL